MAMCRLNVVKSGARKPQGKCGKCGTPIEKGDQYRWWKGRYTPRYVRCMALTCTPQSFELETNPLRSEDMQGADAHSEATSRTDDALMAAGALRSAISFAESIRDQLDERIDNLAGTNFESGDMAQALEYSRDAFDEYISTAEGVADELEAMDEMPDESEYDPTRAPYANEDDPEQAAEDAYTLARDTYEGEVENALDGLDEWPELDLGQ